VSRVRALIDTPGPTGARWSIRALADATGLSRASVHRIVRTFQSDTRDVSLRARSRQLPPRAPRSKELPV
jgi:hypothetical protein